MPSTVRGVYYNLEESKYSIAVDGVEYFFSSKLYLDKFKNGYKRNRQKFEWFFKGKGIPLNYNHLSDFQFYCMVEKRGFRMIIERNEVDWQEARKYVIQKLH